MRVTVVKNEARPHFRSMTRRSKNMRPQLKAVMSWIRAIWRSAFKTKADPVGGRWAKRKEDKPWSSMVNTRTLVSSLRTSVSRLSGEAQATAPYATFPHTGTRNMPRRRALTIPQAVTKRISAAIKHYIVEGQVTK